MWTENTNNKHIYKPDDELVDDELLWCWEQRRRRRPSFGRCSFMKTLNTSNSNQYIQNHNNISNIWTIVNWFHFKFYLFTCMHMFSITSWWWAHCYYEEIWFRHFPNGAEHEKATSGLAHIIDSAVHLDMDLRPVEYVQQPICAHHKHVTFVFNNYHTFNANKLDLILKCKMQYTVAKITCRQYGETQCKHNAPSST